MAVESSKHVGFMSVVAGLDAGIGSGHDGEGKSLSRFRVFSCRR